MEITEKKPKVSVCVVTYNQEKYIHQCLQSIIDQETNFNFEVIVSDDCSTDATRSIVQALADKYPEKIKPIYHEKNIGAFANFLTTHQMANGEYVCHMDGDDYALPGKLMQQAHFLDINPSCQIVWHRMGILNEVEGKVYAQSFDVAELVGKRWSVDDMICNITVGLHSSKMYRQWNRCVESGPLPALDFSENICHLHQTGGYGAFVGAQVLGVYRAGIGISKNAGSIRMIIYQWLYYFHSNNMGNKSLISTKLLLMTLSDLKHRVGSFWFGLRTLSHALNDLIPFRIYECRKRRSSISLSKTEEEFFTSL